MSHCLSIDQLSQGSFITLFVWLGIWAVFLWALFQRQFFGRTAFLLTNAAMLWWLAAAFMELGSADVACKVFWAGAAWPGIVLLPTAWAFFLYDYAFCRIGPLGAWRKRVLVISPLIVLAFVISNPWHGLFYGPETQMELIDGSWEVNYDHGVLFFVTAFYLYGFMLASIGICVWGLVRSPRSYRGFFAVLLFITVTPLLGNIGYVFFGFTFLGFDPTPFRFSLVLFMLGWLIFTNRVFDIRTVAKEMLFFNASNPVLVFDVQGELAALNPAAEQVFGGGLKIGSDLRQCAHFDGWIDRLLEQEEVPAGQTLELGERLFSLMISPLEKPLDRKNPIMGWVLQCTDISERRALEAALKQAAEDAESANRSKSLFLANMSHEIRTPLNGVLGMAGLLADRLEDPENRDMVETIRHSGELLLRILNDILDVSKIEAGELVMEDTVFDPTVSARQTVAIYRIAADAKALDLQVDITESLSMRRGDPVRFEQILHNLLSNAVKFTQEGQVSLQVQDSAGGDLCIEVTDTGIGMTEGQQASVFQDFKQGDDSISRRFGGTGLGLSIVRRLVDLMQGEVRLSSQLGMGSTVSVRLPLAQVSGKVSGFKEESEDSVLRLKGLRVLIADDNQTNRMLLAGMLRRLGFEVVTVEDGRQALDGWRPGAFDLLLLDYAMPELSGTEVLEAIREKARLLAAQVPPALCVSANVSAQHTQQYATAGFVGQVSKPFQTEDLVAAIRRALAV